MHFPGKAERVRLPAEPDPLDGIGGAPAAAPSARSARDAVSEHECWAPGRCARLQASRPTPLAAAQQVRRMGKP